MTQDSIRLNKYISETGLCSRREADKYIIQGSVFINGKKAIIGDQVKVGDRVRVNGNDLEPRQGEDLVFIAFNKPVGVTSTSEENVRNNIVDFVNHSTRIFPIGRLDKDSQGLIFLTNNGDIVNKILRAGNKHEKEYLVTVNKALNDSVITGMAAGVPILGVATKKCKIIQESAITFRIILIQGLNRQIRRMCEHFDYEVVKLERIRIMNITLKGLPIGEWRDLSEVELKSIDRLIKNSNSDKVKREKDNFIPEKESKNNKDNRNSKKNSFDKLNSASSNRKINNSEKSERNNPDKRKKGTFGNSTKKTGGRSFGKR